MKKKPYHFIYFSTWFIPLTCYLLLNFIATKLSYQWDTTDAKIHSLSDNTISSLQQLNNPITINYYVSKSENSIPFALRAYGEKVEFFLDRLQQIGDKSIQVIRHDPKPGSHSEELAKFDNITSHFSGENKRFYFGISISSFENKVTIPFLHPKREGLLEYDLLQAIRRVSTRQLKKIALLSTLPVTGGYYKSDQGSGQFPSWIFVQELQKNYEVVSYENVIEKLISSPPDLLILIHPVDITLAAEKLIDQYVVNGGKLIVILDPFSVTIEMIDSDQSNQLMSSNIHHLLDAWGVEYNANRVVSDMLHRTHIDRGFGPEESHTVINITPGFINTADPVTAGINNLGFAYSGYFTSKNKQEDRFFPLVNTSQNSSTISATELVKLTKEKNQQLLLAFQSDGISNAIVAKLSAPLPSAFSQVKDNKTSITQKSKTISDTQAILFADADFIFDPFAGETVSLSSSQQTVKPYNGNLALFSNAVAHLIDNNNVASAQNKGSIHYPLVGLDIIRANINEKFQKNRSQLLQDITSIEKQLITLSSNRNNKNIKKLVQFKNEHKQLQSQHQQKHESLVSINQQIELSLLEVKNVYQWVNILLLPLTIMIIGTAVIYRRHYRTRAL